MQLPCQDCNQPALPGILLKGREKALYIKSFCLSGKGDKGVCIFLFKQSTFLFTKRIIFSKIDIEGGNAI